MTRRWLNPTGPRLLVLTALCAACAPVSIMADSALVYRDGDGDGYGDDNDTQQVVEATAGWVGRGGDCDDNDASIHPGAVEVCDRVDRDCDGVAPCAACDGIVPLEYSTIQAAITQASSDEHLCLERGVYSERIDFLGKEIVLEGIFGAAETTLDGQGIGPVVTFATTERSGTTLRGVTVTGGSAVIGGGVYMLDSSPTLLELTVSGNAASSHGGGVYVDGGTPSLISVTLEGNSAEQNGGGLYAVGSLVTVLGATVRSNSAANAGGGLYTHETELLLQGSAITDNSAESGGGLYISNDSATVGNTLFHGNQASLQGGAVQVDGDGVSIDNCIFTENTAYQYGGALRSYGDGLWIANSLFVGNDVTDGWGGGLFSCCEQHDGQVENTLFAFNHAGVYGGAVYLNGSAYLLRNVAILDNWAPSGGGLGFYHQNDLADWIELLNVDLSFNEATQADGGGGINGYDSTALPVLSACNLYGNINGAVGTGLDDPTGQDGNMAVDPQYLDRSGADASAWDLHLDPASLLLDAGAATLQDPDGDASDVGLFGGPNGASWDLDGDGAPAWYQPGPYDSSTYPSLGLDCDDWDAAVGPEHGC